MNLKTGESYIGRLAITGNQQIYLPTEIQQMLKLGFGMGKFPNRRNAAPVTTFHDLLKISVCLRFRG